MELMNRRAGKNIKRFCNVMYEVGAEVVRQNETQCARNEYERELIQDFKEREDDKKLNLHSESECDSRQKKK